MSVPKDNNKSVKIYIKIFTYELPERAIKIATKTLVIVGARVWSRMGHLQDIWLAQPIWIF